MTEANISAEPSKSDDRGDDRGDDRDGHYTDGRSLTVTALKTPQDHTLLDALPPGLGLATTAGSGDGKDGRRAPPALLAWSA